jgi:hypothetical protein
MLRIRFGATLLRRAEGNNVNLLGQTMKEMANGLELEQDTKESERNFSQCFESQYSVGMGAYKLMPLIEFTWEC